MRALAYDVAMHVAASNPQYATVDAVPADAVAKERALLVEQAKIENSKAEKPKPDDIVVKMVEGRLRKSLAEITLAGQPFVKDPNVTVEKLLAGAKAKVTAVRALRSGRGHREEAGRLPCRSDEAGAGWSGGAFASATALMSSDPAAAKTPPRRRLFTQ